MKWDDVEVVSIYHLVSHINHGTSHKTTAEDRNLNYQVIFHLPYNKKYISSFPPYASMDLQNYKLGKELGASF